MFNENSGLVTVWVDLIRQGTYRRDQCPALSNLKDMVLMILDEGEQ